MDQTKKGGMIGDDCIRLKKQHRRIKAKLNEATEFKHKVMA